ncbi:putative Fe-S cluster assembly protein SufT [Coxiella-like endosymbiont of Rhipicephalus sanguineus]|uniref:putative Fe-S cluster assembly protein SufT n=1 Tax=Coxiella-like endosymbiont of Rhipicephalus sanguineus TaxID=1955402 RepID=UPI00203BC0E8|nr:putative Fe-S cluster assembly protein SufT [Coxiella-like endosymbiont of Rhipicephalus sanguineus]MBT8506641.1 putative Fe-S cluster assembly protein SufT [Coxiella-like endosymbiont of Rhipicephalus sanguineus]
MIRNNEYEKEIIVLSRDTTATLVPSGTSIRVPQGTEVTVVQSSGDTFTVNIFGNLVRIEGRDADALGKAIKSPLEDLPPDATIKDKVWAQLSTVFDPEIPVNIVELGLVYVCDIERLKEDTFRVVIEMTLTAPGCGMGPVLVEDVKRKILAIPEVNDAEVEIVFDPPWDREMMSDAAKLQLGVFY